MNYLAASDYFKSGDADKALEQFRNAATKSALPRLLDGVRPKRGGSVSERGLFGSGCQSDRDVVSPAPASGRTQAGGDGLAGTGRALSTIRGRGAGAGSASWPCNWRANLEDGAQQKFLINQLVGIAIERQVLAALDPNSAYDSSGRTVQNRIEEMNQTRKSFKVNVAPIEGLLPTMTPTDQVAYFDRMRIYGEVAAAKWAVNKYAK